MSSPVMNGGSSGQPLPISRPKATWTLREQDGNLKSVVVNTSTQAVTPPKYSTMWHHEKPSKSSINSAFSSSTFGIDALSPQQDDVVSEKVKPIYQQPIGKKPMWSNNSNSGSGQPISSMVPIAGSSSFVNNSNPPIMQLGPIGSPANTTKITPPISFTAAPSTVPIGTPYGTTNTSSYINGYSNSNTNVGYSNNYSNGFNHGLSSNGIGNIKNTTTSNGIPTHSLPIDVPASTSTATIPTHILGIFSLKSLSPGNSFLTASIPSGIGTGSSLSANADDSMNKDYSTHSHISDDSNDGSEWRKQTDHDDFLIISTGLDIEMDDSPADALNPAEELISTPPPNNTSSGALNINTNTIEDLNASEENIPGSPASSVSSGDPLSTPSSFGEHPYGEHPSRTLFVRNINSNVDDEELRSLFESYGPIRSMYTQCKHRGFVMISYYDIRHAKNAMRHLQNKVIRRRKIDIHYSIPKENPSEKDQNQGTLVVFNLDPSTTNEELKSVFGMCGEIKEIRETPNKKHHKFIEFYDVRDADKALKTLNKTEIKGKKIKIEPSRPGGARKTLISQLASLEMNEESGDTNRQSFQDYGSFEGSNSGSGTPASSLNKIPSHIANSPNEDISNGNSPVATPSPVTPTTPVVNVPSIPIIVPSMASSISQPSTITPSSATVLSATPPAISLGLNRAVGMPVGMVSVGFGSSNSSNTSSSGNNATPLRDFSSQFTLSTTSPSTASTSIGNSNSNGGYASQSRLIQKSHSSSGGGNSLNGSFAFNSSTILSAMNNNNANGGSGIATPLGFTLSSSLPIHSLPISSAHSILGVSSASGTSASLNNNSGNGISDTTAQTSPKNNNSIFKSEDGTGSTTSGIAAAAGSSSPSHAHRRHRSDAGAEDKSQFYLDANKVREGGDKRTTLMIKNIPNKYSQKMLLAAVDERHKGTYDFFYLPIDFKNKCNVGYAFVNFINPLAIPAFHEEFNNRKWDKFNSEKVCEISYARIQGKNALITHFQNSSLMTEDKKCRPIIFHSDGPNVGEQEPFPLGSSVRTRRSSSVGKEDSRSPKVLNKDVNDDKN